MADWRGGHQKKSGAEVWGVPVYNLKRGMPMRRGDLIKHSKGENDLRGMKKPTDVVEFGRRSGEIWERCNCVWP